MPNNIFSNLVRGKQRIKAMNIPKTIKTLSALAVVATLSAPTYSFAQTIGEAPIKAYGDQIIFDVFRKGSPVGTHEVTFRRDGDDIIADTRFQVSIKILIVPVYSYLYTSNERWRDGKLVSFTSETNDNGDVSDLQVKRENDALVLTGSGGAFTAPGDLYPTTHWNSGVIGSTQVINTITGKINNIELQSRGIETVSTKHGDIQATHYAYQGDLTTEVWYDSAGKWVKMRFPGKDGVMIEYKCRECGSHRPETGALSIDGEMLAQINQTIREDIK